MSVTKVRTAKLRGIHAYPGPLGHINMRGTAEFLAQSIEINGREKFDEALERELDVEGQGVICFALALLSRTSLGDL